MDVPIITFEEITKLNDHDWDQAYAVLNYHLENGNIKKEVQDSGLVVYHNSSGVQRHKLIHENIFSPEVNSNVLMRPRRKRINKDEGKE